MKTYRNVGHLFLAACGYFLPAYSAHAADVPDCRPLKLINSIKMTTTEDRSRFFVPVTINGTPKKLLLDTGGAITQISKSTVQELNLGDTFSKLASRDLGGNLSDRAVRVATFDLGNQRGENLKFQIAPFPSLPDEAAGILSTDLFLQYDIDLDFGAERLNYFSQDHCDGRVAYWPERPLAVLPVDLSNGHLNIDVTLDGKDFHAALDTGAPITTAGAFDIASAFKFERGSPELPIVGQDKENPHINLYGHNFERLSIGDITVLHPQIQLATSVSNPHRIGPEPSLGRIIIGMNVLKQLHIYIAYGEKKLYITPAGTGESAIFKATAPP
jgi:predicted aspartyl protease